MQSYKDLSVWRNSIDLVCEVYKLTLNFPHDERFGLTSQIRRAAVSIASNIAEGRRRGTDKDFRHFLIISFGSGAELETQLEIAKRIRLISDLECQRIDSILDQTMRMLNRMIKVLS